MLLSYSIQCILFYFDKSKVYIKIDESSVQLYIFSLAKNAGNVGKMSVYLGLDWGQEHAVNAAS